MPFSGSTIPNEVTGGDKAITVQGYGDLNAKYGKQQEASTTLQLAGLASNYTLFITGSLPVILKGREISYTGEGVLADIYREPVYTGGSVVDTHNANDINPVAPQVRIWTGITVTNNGILRFATRPSLGNTSNQGKGGNVALGSDRILRPNSVYLLVLTSTDSQQQTVSSFLTWYEGKPDVP
jgi:hypothetical protein